MTKYLISILTILLLLSTNKALANEIISPKLTVNPPRFELDVDRGQVFEDRMMMFNNFDKPLPIKVKTVDFSAIDESGEMVFEESSKDISVAPRLWFEIGKENFILDPGEGEEISFKINIPEDAEIGGHYATVFFEPQVPSHYFKEDQPKAIPVLGIIFLIAVEVENRNVDDPMMIAEFSIPEKYHLKTLGKAVNGAVGVMKAEASKEDKFSTRKAPEAPRALAVIEARNFDFTLRVKNNDIFHVKPRGKLIVMKNRGRIAGITDITKTTILPRKTRRFPVNFEATAPAFIEKRFPAFFSDYVAKIMFIGKHQAWIKLSSEEAVIQKRVSFWVLPWKMITIHLLVGVLLVLGFRRIRLVIRKLKAYENTKTQKHTASP